MAATRKKDAVVRLSADIRQLKRKLTTAKRYTKDLENQVRSTDRAMSRTGRGKLFGDISGRAKQAQKMLAGGLALGAVVQVKKVKALEQAISDVVVQARKGRRWVGLLRSEVLSMSEKYGIASEEMLTFAGRVVQQTGDLKVAIRETKTFARIAFATGTSLDDLGNIFAQLGKVGVISTKDVVDVIGTLSFQAGKGAIEIKQMAAEFPELLNILTSLNQKGTGAAKAMGALFQVAIRGAKGPEEARTALVRFFAMITKNAPRVEKILGVSLRNAKGQFLEVGEMSERVFLALAKLKSENRLGGVGPKLFGIRGQKIALSGAQVGEAEIGRRRSGGGAAGAWSSTVGRYAPWAQLRGGPTGGGRTEIEKLVKLRGEHPVTKWNKAMAKMTADLHRYFLPLMERFAEVLPDLAKGLGWALDNSGLLIAAWAGFNVGRLIFGITQLGRAATTTAGAAAGAAGGVRGLGIALPLLGVAIGLLIRDFQRGGLTGNKGVFGVEGTIGSVYHGERGATIQRNVETIERFEKDTGIAGVGAALASAGVAPAGGDEGILGRGSGLGGISEMAAILDSQAANQEALSKSLAEFNRTVIMLTTKGVRANVVVDPRPGSKARVNSRSGQR